MEQTAKKIRIPLIYLALALATFIAFEPVRYNDFVGYDDPFYVTNNPHVNGGITFDSVVWAFTNSLGANWHPLTSLSHMLDCELFGLNPLYHHLMSLLFHIASSLLLFEILKKMTGSVWASAFVAAAFALHPLRVESVAWVASRKDVLSVFFWMLTMAAYIRYTEHPGIGRYLLVVLAFCLGLMAKPMVVTLPFVLLLLDYWPLCRFQWPHQSQAEALPKSESVKLGCQSSPLWRLVAEKIPLFILAAASSGITFIVQQSEGAMMQIDEMPLNFRITNALFSYAKYIEKMIWPSRLAVFYPHPGGTLSIWWALVAALLLLAISVWVIRLARSRRYLLVGWLWYLGTLVPVVGLVQVGGQARADRYTYLPSVGIFIMVAWGTAALAAKWRYRKLLLSISATIALTALLISTHLQVKYWQNEIALYKRALAVTENNYMMLCNYGSALIDEGHYDEALKHLGRALQINPRFYYTYYGIGRVYLKQEKFAEAIEYFNKALRFKPDYHKAYFNLGVALLKEGKTDEAIENWKRAVSLKADYPDANCNLGVAMTEQGKYAEALNYFRNALRGQPNWAEAYYEMGRVYYLQGNRVLAIKQCTEALRIKPDYIIARITLAHTLVEIGNIQPAVEHYYKVLQSEPNQVSALKNLARIFATTEDAKLQNPADAVKFAERACGLTNYKQPGALDTLAVAYAAVGRFPEAIETAEEAKKLAETAGKKDLAQKIQKRLQLYKVGQSYRQPQPAQKINEVLTDNGIIKTE